MIGNKKILFNISAHESIDALNDLIDSIIWSYDNSYIIINANGSWVDFDSSKLKFINEKVFVNPNKYSWNIYTGGLGSILILNIDYFNSLNIDYDYVVLTASNELYVKKIDINYIDSVKYGSSYSPMSIEYDKSKFTNIIEEMNEISLKNGMYHGFHEGAFFTKNVADELLFIYKKYFGNNFIVSNASEENLLPTILYNIIEWNPTPPLCLFYHQSVTIDMINDFINTGSYNQFSIKRINRFDYQIRNELKTLRK